VGRFRVALRQRGMAAVASVDSLTDDLFALEEPWRSRFLALVASRATWQTDLAKQPTPEEVAAWLSSNPALYRWTSVLLHSWERPRSVDAGGSTSLFSEQYGCGVARKEAAVPSRLAGLKVTNQNQHDALEDEEPSGSGEPDIGIPRAGRWLNSDD
jgi:hypothetical protein